MEIIEIIPGQSFTTAAELPNKRIHWVNGTQKSSPSGNSGGVKPGRIVPNAARGVFAEQQKTDRSITGQNKRRLVLRGGKRRWVLESEYMPG